MALERGIPQQRAKSDRGARSGTLKADAYWRAPIAGWARPELPWRTPGALAVELVGAPPGVLFTEWRRNARDEGALGIRWSALHMPRRSSRWLSVEGRTPVLLGAANRKEEPTGG
jgi:hypothetical protein